MFMEINLSQCDDVARQHQRSRVGHRDSLTIKAKEDKFKESDTERALTCNAMTDLVLTQFYIKSPALQGVGVYGTEAIVKAPTGSVEEEDTEAKDKSLSEHEKKFDLFLSYRVSSDKDLVRKLYDQIKKQFPDPKIFLDEIELKLGEGWKNGFAEAIMNSRMVVLIMSRRTFSCAHGSVGCNNGIGGFHKILVNFWGPKLPDFY